MGKRINNSKKVFSDVEYYYILLLNGLRMYNNIFSGKNYTYKTVLKPTLVDG